MPTYDFHCKDCGAEVTVTASMTELKTPGCLSCMKPMIRRYTVNAVQFKGEGFYSNDKKPKAE